MNDQSSAASTFRKNKRMFISTDFGTGEGSSSFLTNDNFHEVSQVFWPPRTVLHGLAQPVPSEQFKQLRARMEQLDGWVREGNTLVLFDHGPAPLRYKERATSMSTSLERAAPLNTVGFEVASGTRVEFCGPAAVAALLQPYVAKLQYQVVLKGEGLLPLLRVARGTPGPDQIVGGYKVHGSSGLIIYLPGLEANHMASWSSYVADAGNIRAALVSKPSEAPSWINDYRTADEKVTLERIANLQEQATKIRSKIAREHRNIEANLLLKRLLFETGAPFVSATAEALSELGFHCIAGPEPRADLLGSDGARYLAIEVKGLEGPAKERDVRQVIQWMAEVDTARATDSSERDHDLERYAEQLAKLPIESGVDDCKGLLIVNTFRSAPLANRTEPSFPEPVLRVLERNDVCAMSGSQLFGLVLQARVDPMLKPEIVREIMQTRGQLQRSKNWQDYLSH